MRANIMFHTNRYSYSSFYQIGKKILPIGLFALTLWGCGHRGVKKIAFKDLPTLGRSSAGQDVSLGGFSGLHYLGKTSEGRYRFITHTDRGPVGDSYNGNRPFLLPDFVPRWIFFSTDNDFKDLVVEKIVLLRTPSDNLSGLPPGPSVEDPVDVYDYLLPFHPNGTNPEAITQDQKGHFWMSDDYIPSLMEFSEDGVLLETFLPGKNFPSVFGQKRWNRGFDGITYFKKNLWVFLESPLKAGPSDLKGPILIFDPTSKKSIGMSYYPFDQPMSDKIGDVANFKDLGLLVLEKNNLVGKDAYRKIYFVPDPAKDGILKKRLVADLVKLGIDEVEKIEGLTVVENRYLVLVNDNDFALRGRPDYLKSGLVPTKSEASFIYVIDLNSVLPKSWSWTLDPPAE